MVINGFVSTVGDRTSWLVISKEGPYETFEMNILINWLILSKAVAEIIISLRWQTIGWNHFIIDGIKLKLI